MKTQQLILILFFGLALFTGCQNEETKHNILFISIDDLKPSINSYGDSKMITPNIDKLASEGVQFNNAFTNIAVCGASRASLMTGIRPSEKRFNDFSTRAAKDVPDAISLNELFKNNGYETISYGKIYHHNDDFGEHWTEIGERAEQADFQDPKSIEMRDNAERGEYGKKNPIIEYPEVSDYAYHDGKITVKAIEKLKEMKENNKPFFLAIGYVSPHLPFIQPKKYWDMYEHEKIELADNPFQPKNSPDIAIEAQHNSAELRKNYLNIPANGPLGDDLSRDLIHGYFASVSYMDVLIGELVDALDNLGLRDNTTIVLWSDHGYFLGEHGFWCKHSTFYEAVHVPLIISSPKFSNNIPTDSFTELVDIYPTLCELTDIEAPSYIQGQSLVSVLEDSSVELKKEIYTRYKQGEAVIDKDYSYTEFVENGQYLGNMLYDMNNDRKQNEDISKKSSNLELVKYYSEKLKAMRAFVDQDPIIN